LISSAVSFKDKQAPLNDFMTKFYGKIVIILLALSTLSLRAASTNDFFADRMVLNGTNIIVNDNNNSATLESGESLPWGGSAGQTLWYSWSAPVSGRVALKSSSCCLNLALGVYTGTSISNLQLVAADRDGLSFVAEAGIAYQIQADGANGGIGDFTITLQESPAIVATNDSFANSILLDGSGASGNAWVNSASVEIGEPAHLDGVPCKSLWWHWQAPVNGPIAIIRNSGSATNVMLALYTGDSN
jgi:hypothetical protein